jgi:hypothetical protein
VRLCMMSDYSVIPQTPAAGDIQAVCRCAVFLVQQGHQVYWLLSTRQMQALSNQASLGPVATDILPTTCQYVIPQQAYHWEGLRLLCINQELWQYPDLHTRLFTFLCLLQRALSCEVFHAWGTLPIAYLAVYTARFLDMPSVVSYGSQMLSAQTEQPFLWDWVARHVSAATVLSKVEQERLLTRSPLTAMQVHVLDPTRLELGQMLTALYTHVCGIATS